MKKKYIVVLLFLIGSVMSLWAQKAGILYFLENSPYRQTINPAFMPVSRVYVGIPALSYMGVDVTSSLGLNDLIKGSNGKAITFLHPDFDRDPLRDKVRKNGGADLDMDMDINILSFGWQLKRHPNLYLHFACFERFKMDMAFPNGFFELLGKGMSDVENTFDVSSLGLHANAYTEVSGGFTYKLREYPAWTIGAKLKILFSTVYMGANGHDLQLTATKDEWKLSGTADLYLAGGGVLSELPEKADDVKDELDVDVDGVSDVFKPAGVGAAIDLGATYRPFEHMSVSASITDLGFIVYKNNAKDYSCEVGGSYTGVPDVLDEGLDFDNVLDDLFTLKSNPAKTSFTKMIDAKLNIGVDALFWKDRVDVGLFSNTHFKGYKTVENLTLGAAFRPVHWFNLALSYTFTGGGQNNFGAGLTLMPYDGIQIFAMVDYIPYKFAKIDDISMTLPYKFKEVSASFGLVIVAGSNNHKKKKEKMMEYLLSEP